MLTIGELNGKMAALGKSTARTMKNYKSANFMFATK